MMVLLYDFKLSKTTDNNIVQFTHGPTLSAIILKFFSAAVHHASFSGPHHFHCPMPYKISDSFESSQGILQHPIKPFYYAYIISSTRASREITGLRQPIAPYRPKKTVKKPLLLKAMSIWPLANQSQSRMCTTYCNPIHILHL